MGRILVGTSGFSYDDWKGEFYPEKTKSGEMLSYYSRRFPVVEVNSTYYAIPSPATFERMVAKTPDAFEFVVKAHKDITHAETTDATSVRLFSDAISPLVQAGRLGCVLAQYPWGFGPAPANLRRVLSLRDDLPGVRIVVECRNAGWATDETLDALRSRQLGFCCVDEPHLKGLMSPLSVATSDTGYVRFHGRNAAKWWKHEQAWERYNYLYSEEELQEWAPRVREISGSTQTTYVFFNNHYRANAAQNALMFDRMLSFKTAEAPTPINPQLSLF